MHADRNAEIVMTSYARKHPKWMYSGGNMEVPGMNYDKALSWGVTFDSNGGLLGVIQLRKHHIMRPYKKQKRARAERRVIKACRQVLDSIQDMRARAIEDAVQEFLEGKTQHLVVWPSSDH